MLHIPINYTENKLFELQVNISSIVQAQLLFSFKFFN